MIESKCFQNFGATKSTIAIFCDDLRLKRDRGLQLRIFACISDAKREFELIQCNQIWPGTGCCLLENFKDRMHYLNLTGLTICASSLRCPRASRPALTAN